MEAQFQGAVGGLAGGEVANADHAVVPAPAVGIVGAEHIAAGVLVVEPVLVPVRRHQHQPVALAGVEVGDLDAGLAAVAAVGHAHVERVGLGSAGQGAVDPTIVVEGQYVPAGAAVDPAGAAQGVVAGATQERVGGTDAAVHEVGTGPPTQVAVASDTVVAVAAIYPAPAAVLVGVGEVVKLVVAIVAEYLGQGAGVDIDRIVAGAGRD